MAVRQPAIVVMGVAGSGKSSVGAALARALGVSFRDGDDLHPAVNIAKMAAGIPLDDADRWPWLDAVGAAMATAEGGIVVACSALKRVYRDRLRSAAGRPLVFVHLDGTKATLAARIAGRRGHFLPPSLLDSQIATLEPLQADEDGFAVGIEPPVEAIVATVARRLSGRDRPA